MSEGFWFRTAGGDMEARPDNASMFHFIGQEAVSRSHVFISQEQTEDSVKGTYVFDIKGEWFGRVMNYMINNGFTVHVNLHEVPPCDEEAYQAYVDQIAEQAASEIPDELPEGWDGNAA